MLQSNWHQAYGLAGKRAIVTGGASGIGKATAILFAQAGATVLVADIDSAGAAATASEIGSSAASTRCDIIDETSVEAMFATATATMGGVDVLANVAAYRRKADTMTMPMSEWDIMHEVTTRGTFLCMRGAIRIMQDQADGGTIVNVSSISARHPTIFRNMHYDSAKAGVDAITRAAAIEFGPKIRVNSVQPGGTMTPGQKTIADDFTPAGPMTQPGRIPLQRWAEPIDQARAILFLASPASALITGHHVPVDGGYHVG